MKITKIEKKKKLYLVEIDQKESLYVTEDTVVKYMLTKEKTLSKNQLEDIKIWPSILFPLNNVRKKK